MSRKQILERKQLRLEEKKNKLLQRSQESDSIDEVREINDKLKDIAEELRDIADELSDIAEDENKNNEPDTGNDDNRSFDPSKTFTTVSSVAMNNRTTDNSRESMEYRTAFMHYVQSGKISDTLQYKRDNQAGTSTNLGVLIPQTVIQKIITGVEKIYGQLYGRVRKTNVAGGVKYPIGSFNAVFNRVTEAGVSDRQNVGGITDYVEFSYKVGEIRLARTLLQTVLSVPVFEEEFSDTIAKAYVKAMDTEIMTGTDANNQMVGILTEANKVSGSRIASSNIITFTADEMADWRAWHKKLFAKIPLSMRKLSPEFVMTANTYEGNIKTLADENNRPVYAETFNPVDGVEKATFYGKEVVFVEDDILKNFDDATDGQYFGMYWVPEEAYAINSSLEFYVTDYFDHETRQAVKTAVVINDGKILDPKYIYLLKKSVPVVSGG